MGGSDGKELPPPSVLMVLSAGVSFCLCKPPPRHSEWLSFLVGGAGKASGSHHGSNAPAEASPFARLASLFTPTCLRIRDCILSLPGPCPIIPGFCQPRLKEAATLTPTPRNPQRPLGRPGFHSEGLVGPHSFPPSFRPPQRKPIFTLRPPHCAQLRNSPLCPTEITRDIFLHLLWFVENVVSEQMPV